MKTIIYSLVVSAALLCMVGCGTKEDSPTPASQEALKEFTFYRVTMQASLGLAAGLYTCYFSESAYGRSVQYDKVSPGYGTRRVRLDANLIAQLKLPAKTPCLGYGPEFAEFRLPEGTTVQVTDTARKAVEKMIAKKGATIVVGVPAYSSAIVDSATHRQRLLQLVQGPDNVYEMKKYGF